MLEFCPLCYKNGHKRKISLSQINLDEAVWLCESTECPWPFGYEDFTFVSRKIGDTWSSEWDKSKPPSTLLKSSESYQISLSELGLDTPPVTPGSGNDVVHKDAVFLDNTCLVTSLNSNTNNGVQSKSNFVSSNNNGNKSIKSFTSECESIDSGVKSNDQESLNNVIHSLRDNEKPSKLNGGFSISKNVNLGNLDKSLPSSHRAEAITESVLDVRERSQDNLSLHESTVKCKKWLSDNSKTTNLGDHSDTSSERNNIGIELRNVSLQVVTSKQKRNSVASSNRTKKLPRIKSIETTNVKLEAVTIHPIQNNNSTPLIDSSETEKDKTEETVTSIACDKSSRGSRIENKTLVIDGIFPISLSYEIQSFVEESATIPLNKDCKNDVKEKLPVVNNSVGVCLETEGSQSTTDCKTEASKQSMKKPLKRTVPKLAKYQGFHFGTLKKKLKPNCEESIHSSLPNLPSPDNLSTCSDFTWSSETSSTTTVDSKIESLVSNPKSTSSLEISSPAISSSDSKSSNSCSPENDQVLDSNLNLDIVLDDLLLNESDGLPQGFGDEWIVSLFD